MPGGLFGEMLLVTNFNAIQEDKKFIFQTSAVLSALNFICDHLPATIHPQFGRTTHRSGWFRAYVAHE
jgi:hypothetical protein